MTEEQVTKSIIRWLHVNLWDVICFDFPQSGTGVALHPNEEIRTTKNKGAIIPDIVAIKDNVVVFFENKDHFDLNDFLKVEELRITTDYSNSIQRLLSDFDFSRIFYGVGLQASKRTEIKTNENLDKIDFAIFVSEKSLWIQHQRLSIF